MKLAYDDRPIERIGVVKDKKFSIKATGKAFRILSSGLYKEKILAIVREISCNAFDAHVASGIKDVPFDVHLPNAMEAFFRVRDHGTGLSNTDVKTLYSTYFESTKTTSDDFIGALGLGSKSPLSYVDSFTVTCYRRKRKRVYTVFFDEEDTPSITLMHVSPWDANMTETGLEVQIPVRLQDINEFCNRAISVYTFFTTKPKVVGNSYYKLEEREPILTGRGFKLYPASSGWNNPNKPKAIMGVVAYPLAFHGSASLSKASQRIIESNIDIEFAIGALDVTAGREELSYDKRTIQSITDRLTEIENELRSTILEKMAAVKNEYEVRCFYGEMSSYTFFFSLFPDGLEYNGKLIKSQDIDLIFPEPVKDCSLTNYEMRGPSVSQRSYTRGNTAQVRKVTAVPNMVFYYDDLMGKKRVAQRLRKLRIDGLDHTKGLQVLRGPEDQIEDFVKLMGGVNYHLTSELPEPPKVSRNKLYPKVLTVSNAITRDSYDSLDVEPEDGGIYIKMEDGYPVRDDWQQIQHHTMGAILRDLKALGIFDHEADEVVFIPKALHKKYLEGEHADQWTCFFKMVREKFDEKMVSANWIGAMAAGRIIRHLQGNSNANSDVKTLVELQKVLPADHGFNVFRSRWTDYERVGKDMSTQLRASGHIGYRMEDKVGREKENVLTVEWKTLNDRYPMLRYVMSRNLHYHRTDTEAMKFIVEYIRLVDKNLKTTA